jgi:hypothetical protein
MDFPYGDRLRIELGPASNPRPLESSPRSNVWSADLAGTPVIVKQIVGGPDAPDRYAREVTALRRAARTDPPVVPGLLGSDPDDRVMVLEHLSDDGPADLVAYATGLARLHAAGPPDGGLPGWAGPDDGDVTAFLGLAARLGVPPETGVAGELTDLLGRLAALPVNALLHGDPCPGNDFFTPAGVRFADLEQASVGCGLVELAYLRIGFPTCWCVIGIAAPLLARAEEAYASAWRDVTGTAPDGDLTDVCAGWLIRGDALVERARRETADHLARLPDEDWSWGTVTARERLAYRLGVVAGLAGGRPDLAGLGRLATALRGRMLDRWPGLRPPPRRRP